MGTVEKIAAGIVAIAFVTTLILPDRQTAKVIGSISDLFTSSLKTAQGRA